MRWIEVKTDGTVNGNSDVADTAQHSETNFVTESYAEWKDRSLKLSCCEVGMFGCRCVMLYFFISTKRL